MHQRRESSHSTLLSAALFYTRGMGWPVIPLTHRVARHPLVTCCSCDRDKCSKPCAHPYEGAGNEASKEPDALAAWWELAPFNIGVPTGRVVDAVEVPASTGAAALGALRAGGIELGPVVATGDRYQFLVRPGSSIAVYGALKSIHRSASALQLRYLGVGDLLVAPPSLLPETRARWVVEPDMTARELPDSMNLLPELVEAARWRHDHVELRMFGRFPREVGRISS